MGTDGHATFDQETHGFSHEGAAFEFDHVGAGGHQTGGVPHGLGGAFGVAPERHVGDDERARTAAGHAFGVIDHLLDRDRQGGLLALQHVAQGITHQDHIDAAAFEQRGKAGVVAGEHDDLAAFGAHLAELEKGDGFGVVLQVAHDGSSSRRQLTPNLCRAQAGVGCERSGDGGWWRRGVSRRSRRIPGSCAWPAGGNTAARNPRPCRRD